MTGMLVSFVCAVSSVLLLLASPSTGHSVSTSSCKTIPGMANFDISKFYGRWYVTEIYDSINTCITLDYAEKPGIPTEVKVSQGRQLTPLDALDVKHSTNYAGTIYLGKTVPSQMTIKWPISGLFGKMSHVIVDTDYTNYALTYECQSIVLQYGSRFSASILSRTPTIDPAIVQQIKSTAAAKGIPALSNFKVVNQQECTAPGDGIHIDTDPDSYKATNLLGLISDEKIETIKTEEDLIKAIGEDTEAGHQH